MFRDGTTRYQNNFAAKSHVDAILALIGIEASAPC
jgi:hypothetical protein